MGRRNTTTITRDASKFGSRSVADSINHSGKPHLGLREIAYVSDELLSSPNHF
jgi:hypothetical protein